MALRAACRYASSVPPAASRGIVLGLGASVIDVFFRIRALPNPGAKGYFQDPTKLQEGTVVGGVTLNHLSWTSQLGVPTGLLALQGVDPLGQQIRASMERQGISLQFLQVGPQYATAVSHVYIDSHGEKTIMMATGSNGALSEEVFNTHFAAAAKKAAMLTAEICQVPLSSILAMLKLARAEGIPTCVDVDVPPNVAVGEAQLGSKSEVLATVSGCTVLKPTMEAVAELLALKASNGESYDPVATGILLPSTADQVAGQLLEALNGPRLIAVTDGSRGCGLALRGEKGEVSVTTVPAVPGVHQIDATGAGDAYFGGMVAGIYHLGMPATVADLDSIGRTAAALGAACCEVLGALPGEKSADRVSELLPQHLRGFARPSLVPEESRDNIGLGPGAAQMTMEEWSRKKNSDKGPAVSSRCKTLTPSVRKPTAEPIRLKGVPDYMPAFVLRGLLSQEECEGLIEAVPTGGPGYLGRDEIYQLYNDRVVKYRFLTHDEALSEFFWQRIRDYVPTTLDGGQFYRVNPSWRFVCYDQGGHQAAHIDGREPVEPFHAQGVEGWVQSRLTLQVYLNSDFQGGELAVVEPEPGGGHRVKDLLKPGTGDALIFYQERLLPPSKKPPYELLHEACDVTGGIKYACRTMVDYVFPDVESAKMTNLKDDHLGSL